MSEPQSALGGARFSGLVEISEAAPRGMITLKGDLGSTKLKNAVKSVAAVQTPAALTGAANGDRSVFWMAPDELLLLSPYGAVADDLGTLAKKLKGAHYLAADVSDARAMFELEGEAVREVLSKLTPVDMHPTQFVPGGVRRTRFGQVAAAIYLQDGNRADVICFRSVARYVFDLLCDAAAEEARVDFF